MFILLINLIKCLNWSYIFIRNLVAYLFKSEWIASSRKTFVALNIDIKSQGEESAKLSCSACTFTQAKLFKSAKVLETYPRYVFSVKGTLKRVFNKVDDSYVRKNRSGKKAEVPFLSFKKGNTKLQNFKRIR